LTTRAIEYDTFLLETKPSGSPGSGVAYLTRYIEAIQSLYNTFNDFVLFYNGEKQGVHQFTILIPQKHWRWYEQLLKNLGNAIPYTFNCSPMDGKALAFIRRIETGANAITVRTSEYDSREIILAMIRACSETFPE